MPWLFFALALGGIIIAFNTFSIGLAAVCLLAALGLIVAGTLNLVSARISKQSKHPGVMLDAKALAEVRRRAGTKDSGSGGEVGVASSTSGGARTKTQEPSDAVGEGSGGGDGGGD